MRTFRESLNAIPSLTREIVLDEGLQSAEPGISVIPFGACPCRTCQGKPTVILASWPPWVGLAPSEARDIARRLFAAAEEVDPTVALAAPEPPPVPLLDRPVPRWLLPSLAGLGVAVILALAFAL